MESDVPMFAAPSPGGIEKSQQYGEYRTCVILEFILGELNTLWHKIEFKLNKSTKKNAVSSKGYSYLSYFHQKLR